MVYVAEEQRDNSLKLCQIRRLVSSQYKGDDIEAVTSTFPDKAVQGVHPIQRNKQTNKKHPAIVVDTASRKEGEGGR